MRVADPEQVIDPGSAAAALQKALSALGRSGAYSSTDNHTTQSAGYSSGYADPSELRVGAAGSGTESFYEAYIIRPTVVERSTVDSRRQGTPPSQWHHQWTRRVAGYYFPDLKILWYMTMVMVVPW